MHNHIRTAAVPLQCLSGAKMRENLFAGSFYPAGKNELNDFIDGVLSQANPDVHEAIKSIVVPHAGYIYSGRIAALAYKAISLQAKNFDSAIIIGPNHTGMGDPIGVSMEDWKIPFGLMKNNAKLSEAIASYKNGISIDEASHAEEHSVEVQLPFVYKALGNVPITPICMGYQDINASKHLAEAIKKAVKSTKSKPLIIASSDFNHYESSEAAKKKDLPLIKLLEALDYEAFNPGVAKAGDSACGFGPITVASIIAKDSGAKKGILLGYSNSGERTKDYTSVVAYASMAFV